MKRVAFEIEQGSNGPIRGDVYLPARPRGAPVVVACHGFKGFKDWGFWPHAGARFTEEGMGLVTFNFSGSGIGEDPETFTEMDRFESNTIGKEVEDLGLVLDAVTSRRAPVEDLDIRRLGGWGHSRGGGVLLVRAGRDPRFRSLVTWASVACFLRIDESQKEAWRKLGYQEVQNQRTGQVFRLGLELLEELETGGAALDPAISASRLKIPALFLHGTQDEAVPVEDARRLAQAAGPGVGELALIQGAGHTFGAAHPFQGSGPDLDLALNRTITWFNQTLD